jgi:hypothetical protein
MPNIIDLDQLLYRAEECRVLAAIVTDEVAANSYLKLADAYEAIAEQERRIIAARAARSITENDHSIMLPSKPKPR